jgi:hypothetical protein
MHCFEHVTKLVFYCFFLNPLEKEKDSSKIAFIPWKRKEVSGVLIKTVGGIFAIFAS